MLAAFLLAGLASAASAEERDFCLTGSGVGQCQNARAVAVDFESGRVYIPDQNSRVNVFTAAGDFLMAFGGPGSGPGQFNAPTYVAVDNTGGPGQGDVYVVDAGNFRVQKFDSDGDFLLTFGGGVNQTTDGNLCTAASGNACGAGVDGSGEGELSSKIGSDIFIGVGPSGTVFLLDSLRPASEHQHRLQRFEPSGAVIPSQVVLFEGEAASAFAVASDGEFFVSSGGGASAVIRRYEPDGSFLGTMSAGNQTTALALDDVDHLFAAQLQSRAKVGSLRVITEFDAGADIVRRFRYTRFNSPTIFKNISGLAAYHSAEGDIFGAEGSRGIKYFTVPPPGPIVPSESLEAVSISNTKATLAAEVNPEGKATSYRFDYVDQAAFEEDGFESPQTKSTPDTAVGAADFELHAVGAVIGCQDPVAEGGEGKCLSPDTTYHYRVVTTNPDNESEEGEGTVAGTFTTRPPLEILATYATEVSTDFARLHADVNPLGIPTVGYFEYVSDAAYQADVGAGGDGFSAATKVPDPGTEGELDFGSGNTGVTRSVTLSLQPGTTYRYRLVATDPLIEPVTSEARTIVTFERSTMPDVCSANEAFRTGSSALLPDCRAYEMVSPLDKGNGDVIVQLASAGMPASLNLSSPSGSKLSYGSYRAFGDAESGAYTSQYIAAREPGRGWASHAITPPREKLNLEGLNMLDTELKSLSPDLCQAWLRTVAEPVLAAGAVVAYPNLYRRQDDECGGKGYAALTTVKPPAVSKQIYSQSLELQGTSTDGSVSIYVAKDNLDEGLIEGTQPPPPQSNECVLTGNEGCLLRLYQHTDRGLRYLCILPGEVPFGGGCSAGTGLYGSSGGEDRQASLSNAISEDGSRVFWTASASGPARIYLRFVEEERTIAVSKEAEEESGTSASQFWGASPDGSKAIFTTANNFTLGQDLYVFDVASETTTLVAGGVSGLLGASEDASYLYFASEDDLSGANVEGNSPVVGKSNLYLYNEGTFEFIITLAGQEGDAEEHENPAPISVGPFSRLSRVTPDGRHATFMSAARPPSGYDNRDAVHGKAAAEVFLYDAEAKELRCASCNPTGSRPLASEMKNPAGSFWVAAQIPPWQNALHAAKPLSDDGNRLFFESTDVLAARDTNGVGDVYQWEAQGSGGCGASDSTFSVIAGGCVELISSGQSARASTFVDASSSGADVFFGTLSSLVSQDYGLVDIYDARVGGGLPAPPPPARECEGESCQSPAPAPQDSTPSSATYVGPSNIPGAQKCAKSKRKVGKNSKKTCAKRKKAKKGKCKAKGECKAGGKRTNATTKSRAPR